MQNAWTVQVKKQAKYKIVLNINILRLCPEKTWQKLLLQDNKFYYFTLKTFNGAACIQIYIVTAQLNLNSSWD
jgi:hypothetical protein